MKYKTFFRLILCTGCLFGHSLQTDAGTDKNSRHNMTNAVLNAKNELVVTPSATSGASDFDFLMGTHTVYHSKLKTRLAGCSDWEEFTGTHRMEPLLGGNGNLELHRMNLKGKTTEGVALRLFNPATRLWSIHWADSRSYTLDTPVVGSFENQTGFFYAKDSYGKQPVLVQFKWDLTRPGQPVWSQAFSVDNGITWEWNWHMRFARSNAENDTAGSLAGKTDTTRPVGVIELRNYVIRHGLRDSFIHYFEDHFIQPQEDLKASLLGQYRVKGWEDNFCWIRGFTDMKDRSLFLPAFYYGPFWKEHKQVANNMLANNDNVYLLRPLLQANDSLEPAQSISPAKLVPANGIAVVDFYTANTKLDQLLPLFAKEYLPLLKKCGISDYTLWTSVPEENDFPRLPVFQDKNLLVVISFYEDELHYEEAMKKISSKMGDDLKLRLQDVVTIKNTMILYPTENTIHKKSLQ